MRAKKRQLPPADQGQAGAWNVDASKRHAEAGNGSAPSPRPPAPMVWRFLVSGFEARLPPDRAERSRSPIYVVGERNGTCPAGSGDARCCEMQETTAPAGRLGADGSIGEAVALTVQTRPGNGPATPWPSLSTCLPRFTLRLFWRPGVSFR